MKINRIFSRRQLQPGIQACYFIVLIFIPSVICAEQFNFEKKAYKFDAGPSTSTVEAGAILLTPDDIFQDKSFGWTGAPRQGFTRKNLARSRSSFTIDGVAGQTLTFHADLPPGEWWVTMWIEAGTKDSGNISLIMGDEQKQLGWYDFFYGPNSISEIYRVFHTNITVGQGGFSFQLADKEEPVRLLGFTLTPDPKPIKNIHHNLMGRIREAGKYGSAVSLDSILVDLESILERDPSDAFAAYWLEQIQLLSSAERYLNMLGWEWAAQKTGLSIFDRYRQAVLILDGLLNRLGGETYPLYERALWQRGRLLYWLGKEHFWANEILGGERDLAALYRRYPDDAMLAMYNGEKIDLPDPCDTIKKIRLAPTWAHLQREALCRLRNFAYWWIEKRQSQEGEFGGHLNDDVELLQFWSSLILVGDKAVFKGWSLLADYVWQSPQNHLGYRKWITNVQHAAEYTAYTTPLMILYSDEETYIDRLRVSRDLFDKLWTGRTRMGRRFFRSAWFNATEIATDPPKNRDLEYNTMAVKPVRYLAWKTGDPKAIELLHEWSRSWASAAMRTDKDKPAGIIPASVRFPDEAINSDEPTWYKANLSWDYYDWEWHAGSLMLDQLLFTYILTDDSYLLQPLVSALNLIKNHGAEEVSATEIYVKDNTTLRVYDSLAPGTPTWAAVILRENDRFFSVASQWRLITGDSRYDDLILRYGTPYACYRLTSNERYLIEGLESLLNELRFNTPLLTSEALFTDRVIIRGIEHLKAMLTGDGIPDDMSPYYAVSWEGTDESFTALVSDTGNTRLGVQIFSHAEVKCRINMRVWQLEPGTYKLKRESSGKTEEEIININGRGQRIPIILPAQTLIKVTFEKTR